MADDPRVTRRTGDPGSGHERRGLIRWVALAAIALFIFLVGYFLAFGPLDEPEPHYPPAGRNLELERDAAPPPQPTPPAP